MIPGLSGSPSHLTWAFGKVVDVHPEGGTVDVMLFSTCVRLVNVPVVGSGTGNTGLIDLPIPDLTTSRDEENKWKSDNTKKRDIIAVVGFIEGGPVCFGFVYPPISEMHFEGEIAKERRLFRHASDWYSWIDQYGSAQWCHPNGTYATLAEDPEKLDLTAKDYDKIWKIKRNLDKVVHFVFSFFNGKEKKEKAKLHIKPDGDASFWAEKRIYQCVGPSGEMVQVEFSQNGNASITAKGSVSITAMADVTVTAKGSATVKAPTITLDSPLVHCTGDVMVEGDVVASGVSLVKHLHTKVTPGYLLSGPPAGAGGFPGGEDPADSGPPVGG